MNPIPTNPTTLQTGEALDELRTARATELRDALYGKQIVVDQLESKAAEARRRVSAAKRRDSGIRDLRQSIFNLAHFAKRVPGLAERMPIGFDTKDADPIPIGKQVVANFSDVGGLADAVAVIRSGVAQCETMAVPTPSDTVASSEVDSTTPILREARDELANARRVAFTYVMNNTGPDSPARQILLRGRKGGRPSKEKHQTVAKPQPTAEPVAPAATLTVVKAS